MYARPHGTTANPNWQFAEGPTDLIPTTSDPTKRGERMVRMVGQTLITQGEHAGKRFAEVMMPWQADLVRYTFGQTDAKGNREVARVGLLIAKGQGKTVLAAAIALAFVVDSHQRGVNKRGLVLIVAAGIASAGIAFQAIHESVLADEHLREEFKSFTARRALRHVASGIEIRVIPPDLGAAVGLRPVLLLLDEIHQAAVDSKDFSTVIDQARRGGANAGVEFLEIGVTTAPAEKSVGFYSEWVAHMKAVRDGKLQDPSTLPVLYQWPVERTELDLGDDTQWWRGCPSLKYSDGDKGTMDATMLRKELLQAQQDQVGKSLELLLSQRMGIEPEQRKTNSKSGLVAMWDQCATLHGRPQNLAKLAIAFDPSSGVDDLFAVGMATMDADGVVAVRVTQHILQSGFDKVPSTYRAIYQDAINQRELFVHDTYAQMETAILDSVMAETHAAGCSYIYGGDRWGMSGFAVRAQERLGGEFKDVSQGWKLSAALAETEALMSSSLLEHAGTPLLTWNVSNLVLDTTGSVPKFRKADAGLSGQGASKIDGAMALLSSVELLGHVQTLDVLTLIG
jgi:phage terminase large subunit-like protein